jgi:hypothetical protein
MTCKVFLLLDQNTLSQGKMKKGDDVADGEVRTCVSQDPMKAILSTEELFLWTQYI